MKKYLPKASLLCAITLLSQPILNAELIYNTQCSKDIKTLEYKRGQQVDNGGIDGSGLNYNKKTIGFTVSINYPFKGIFVKNEPNEEGRQKPNLKVELLSKETDLKNKEQQREQQDQNTLTLEQEIEQLKQEIAELKEQIKDKEPSEPNRKKEKGKKKSTDFDLFGIIYEYSDANDENKDMYYIELNSISEYKNYATYIDSYMRVVFGEHFEYNFLFDQKLKHGLGFHFGITRTHRLKYSKTYGINFVHPNNKYIRASISMLESDGFKSNLSLPIKEDKLHLQFEYRKEELNKVDYESAGLGINFKF